MKMPPCYVLEDMANLAIEEQTPVVIYNWEFTPLGLEVEFDYDITRPGAIALVPDVIVVELQSNGLTSQRTLNLNRDDGRSVSVYRTPQTQQ